MSPKECDSEASVNPTYPRNQERETSLLSEDDISVLSS